ncbi:hypothetical protein LOCC1_G007816 [Lachnellula occidentalis]|uniref:Uncharacterized protein n=1 Tax=Lachnellula occidentalis TaxID=215460 RepID=A0A8H8RGK7_9HELO|nr:hypothetical protein LOCC1_G007816 [Lachnellula occidentalis]
MSLRQLSLLGMAALSWASPLMVRDDPVCYPQTMPIGQAVSTCPHKTALDSDGHCTSGISTMPGDNGCDSYCEQTLEAIYGREVPFHVGVCQNATTCLVANGEAVTYTNTYTVDVGLKRKRDDLIEQRGESSLADILTAAFNIGASYSWSKSVAYTTTTTFSKTLDGATCGYWTFIPYLTISCGVLSEAATSTMGAGYYGTSTLTTCDTSSITDTQHYCNTTPYYDENNHADGVVVFVYADCTTGIPSKTGQAAAYNYPGVSSQEAPA